MKGEPKASTAMLEAHVCPLAGVAPRQEALNEGLESFTCQQTETITEPTASLRKSLYPLKSSKPLDCSFCLCLTCETVRTQRVAKYQIKMQRTLSPLSPAEVTVLDRQ